jgi:hypothetical protein
MKVGQNGKGTMSGEATVYTPAKPRTRRKSSHLRNKVHPDLIKKTGFIDVVE